MLFLILCHHPYETKPPDAIVSLVVSHLWRYSQLASEYSHIHYILTLWPRAFTNGTREPQVVLHMSCLHLHDPASSHLPLLPMFSQLHHVLKAFVMVIMPAVLDVRPCSPTVAMQKLLNTNSPLPIFLQLHHVLSGSPLLFCCKLLSQFNVLALIISRISNHCVVIIASNIVQMSCYWLLSHLFWFFCFVFAFFSVCWVGVVCVWNETFFVEIILSAGGCWISWWWHFVW